MSVDFWMPQAPVERYQPYPEEDPDFWCTRPVPPFTELNLANSNAYAFLALMDPEGCEGHGGEWRGEVLDQVFTRLWVFRNTAFGVALEVPEHRPYSNVIVGGRDAEYVRDRLDRLLAIVRVAREYGFYVAWG